MFILLSKLLPLFIYPLGLSVILLIAAFLVHHNRKASRGLVLAACLILWLSSTSGFSNLLARSLDWRFLPPDEIPSADVIVLLGGGTEPAAYPRAVTEINGAGDRVLYAAKLFAEGKAPRILLSGGEIAWLNDGSSTPAQDMANILMDIGVPENALILRMNLRIRTKTPSKQKRFCLNSKLNKSFWLHQPCICLARWLFLRSRGLRSFPYRWISPLRKMIQQRAKTADGSTASSTSFHQPATWR